MSWHEAQAYCKWAAARLPTEAEWEYACRAGTTTEYSFGDDANDLGQHGWFTENSGGQTQPVGAKEPNPWGLHDMHDMHDMHGNVWEWCADGWRRTYTAGDIADPCGPEDSGGRVGRGGSWASGARGCRSACRLGVVPEYRDGDLGFRVAGVPLGVPAQERQGRNAEPEAET